MKAVTEYSSQVLRIEAFAPEDLGALRRQGGNDPILEPVMSNPQHGQAFVLCGPSFTAFDLRQRIVLCGGLIFIANDRALGWVLPDKDVGHHAVAVSRLLISILNDSSLHIETAMPPGIPAAERWLRILGFTKNGTATARYPGFAGETAEYAYARKEMI